MKKIVALILVAALFVLGGCKKDRPVQKEGMFAVFETSAGSFTCELEFEKMPITVGNFVGLAEGTREFTDMATGNKVKRPFYDGIIIHRVVPNFVIQGGDPIGNGTGGPGYYFIDEFDSTLSHNAAGVLSMANAGPDTNGSQFFITLRPVTELDSKHAVFGRVIDGMDVIANISTVEVDHFAKPVEDIVIRTVKIIRAGKKAEEFDAEKEFAKSAELKAKREEQAITDLANLLKTMQIDESKIVNHDSGLRYYVEQEGKGRAVAKGNKIKAHYEGFLANGTKFDSSYDHGSPMEVPIGLGSVIQGWDIGFMGMKEGEKRVLIIPPHLGYGKVQAGPIPPNSTLIFKVELLEVLKGE